MNVKKNNALKLTCLILSLLLMSGSLASCKEPVVADKDGAAMRYTMDEIEEEGYEGLFTLNTDETFSPLPADVPGYKDVTEETDPERSLWYTDNNVSFTELIPKVNSETPIVVIYNNDSAMPEKTSWYLERYEALGATFGAHIWLDEDKTMYISEEDALEGTSAEDVLSSGNSEDENHEIQEISGSSTKLPIQNVENNVRMLLGLTYGKKYTVKYLQGTKTKTVDIIADTYGFQSSEIIPMNAPYLQTEKGYFIINLPAGIKKGFYYISDLGFFYYTGEDQ